MRRRGSAIVTALRRLVEAAIGAFFAAFRPRASLVGEYLAFHRQLAAFVREGRRPPLRSIDRAFWVVALHTRPRWADVLALMKPATVIVATVRRLVEFYMTEHNDRTPRAAFDGRTPDESYFGLGVAGRFAQRPPLRRPSSP